jgi:ribosomal protein S18 acetylase RimI-like enzyme
MTEAERVHEALRATTERLCGLYDVARYERRRGYDLFVFPPIPVAQFNAVWPLEDASAEALEAALAEIAELGLPSSVQVRSGVTPAAADEAKRLGLTNEAPLPGLAVQPDELTAGVPQGLVVSRIDDEQGLHDAMATAAAGFGTTPSFFEPVYTAQAAALDGAAYYLGRVEGTAVATSVGFMLYGTVGIFNVATPPEHRGRGYGGALTAAAARGGFANGADLAWLQSSAMGLSVYRGLGFREVERYVLLTRPEAA